MWQCSVRKSDVRSDLQSFPAVKPARPNGIVAFPMTDAAAVASVVVAAAAVSAVVAAAARRVLSDAHLQFLRSLAHYVSVSSIDPRILDIYHFEKIEKKMKRFPLFTENIF